MYRIFIVEDDEGIASAVKKHLGSWGYDVKCAEDFSNVISEFNSFEPHIVLMDISQPFYNGLYWCGEIRKNSKIPVVFLSSQSDNMNIITAMNMWLSVLQHFQYPQKSIFPKLQRVMFITS